MPPTSKPAGPQGGGGHVSTTKWQMPAPPAIVIWRNAPGGETAYAIVTKYNKQSVSVMIFPPDSRIGVPKDGVRFIDDPWNKIQGLNADSGVWDFTDEHKVLRFAMSALVEKGVVEPEPSNSHLFARLSK